MKPYFAKENVLRGMFELCHKLFDVKISENKSIPSDVSWHDDVSLFDVCDATSGEYISSFFWILSPGLRISEVEHGWMWCCRATIRSNPLPISFVISQKMRTRS